MRLTVQNREIEHRIHHVDKNFRHHQATISPRTRRQRAEHFRYGLGELLFVNDSGCPRGRRRLHRQPDLAARRIRRPQPGHVIDETVQEPQPVERGYFAAELSKLVLDPDEVLAVQFAHDDVIVREELVKRTKERKSTRLNSSHYWPSRIPSY